MPQSIVSFVVLVRALWYDDSKLMRIIPNRPVVALCSLLAISVSQTRRARIRVFSGSHLPFTDQVGPG